MTNPANSATRKARWISLVAGAAALTSVTAGALPASAAERVPPPSAGTVHGQRSLDTAALARLMEPGTVAGATMLRVGGPGVRWTAATAPLSQDPGANFRIGSITKMFTSTVVMQLIAEGRIGMDTPIQQILPGTLPADWKPITVGQLLSHTSGIRQPCAPLPKNDPLTPAQVLAHWTDTAAGCTAPPAPAEQQYNGVNYFLLGMAIERVTGRSYAEEVQRRIARPLGLRHTYLPTLGDTTVADPLATPVAPIQPWAWAEGGMISNASDLEKFLGALLRGRLLPPAQQRQLFVMPSLAGDEQDAYSMGGLLRHRMADRTYVWGKTGSMYPNVNGVFATADGRRVLTYSFTPAATATKENTIDHIAKIAEAAL